MLLLEGGRGDMLLLAGDMLLLGGPLVVGYLLLNTELLGVPGLGAGPDTEGGRGPFITGGGRGPFIEGGGGPVLRGGGGPAPPP
jgi:hypothetical protein